ncbi:ribonuclease J [Spiroplasma endosymbiont of Dasysyrphus albostriatus]|uniref:ribonuclease J n=1 Tax=Spiroplasma endosymbiont of Dasysyrphus albostriatus TaxID=3066299 RepID=UPI0030D07FC1
MAKIKVFALGGLDERGKNLYVVEVNDKIFVFDAGIRLPEREILGIDIIIPDYTYLKENKHRIQGIFISKPSDDAFGALPYILKDFNKIKPEYKVPIFTSKLTDFMIKQKLERFRFINQNEIIIKTIEPEQKVSFGNVVVKTFKTTTSIPGSLGFVLTVNNGENIKLNETIVYTGDYIFDGEHRSDFTTDIQHLASVSKNDVLLLISEATCANRKAFTAPKHKIQTIIEPVLKEAPGRVILACYDQDLYRVSEILNAIKETDSKRKIAVYGATLYDILLKVNDLNAFNIDKSQIINLAQTIGTKDTVIIVTGSGERLFTRMNKIAIGNDDYLKLESQDTIILATPPIPGNELAHAALLDDLARTDVKVINISEKQAWSLNASYEDIKLMVNIIEPKYFLPVKGLYKDFVAAQAAAIDAGVLHNNALIHDNGEVITFENAKLIDTFVKQYVARPSRFNDKNATNKTTDNLIKTGDVYVDGIGVGDIGSIVISERKQLQRDGILITGVTINRKTKEIISLIDAQMRGVVYLTNNEEMLKKLQNIIINVIEKYKTNNAFSLSEVKTKMKNDLQDYIKKETGKLPMILTVVNEI